MSTSQHLASPSEEKAGVSRPFLNNYMEQIKIVLPLDGPSYINVLCSSVVDIALSVRFLI